MSEHLVTPDEDLTATETAPARVGERIASLDFIRGIAVMGILAANIVAFGQPMAAYMYPEAFVVPHGDDSGWLWVAQFVLIDNKMRGLFSILFGAGMYLFMERAWAKGAGRGLQARRLGWLMLFGVVHFFFIWRGDILFSYALCGMLALALMQISARDQFIVGALGYFAGAIVWGGMMLWLYLVAHGSAGEPGMPMAEMRAELEADMQVQLQDGELQTQLISQGNYFGYVAHMISEHWSDLSFFIFIWIFETLPLMLMGMALYRWGFFSGALNQTKMRVWGWSGLIVGGAISLAIALWVREGGFTFYGTQAAMVGFSYLPRLAMILGLLALLTLYGARASGWLAERISAAGRAAFTNYLGTSIVMLFVFHGWALGLFGQLNRPQLYLVVLISWVLMLAWSKPWLERYRFGPLEWLWRCLTYGKLFPLRR